MDDVISKITKLIEDANDELEKGGFLNLPIEPIASDIDENEFNQLAEQYPFLKMKYDDGDLFIIEIQGTEHRSVISNILHQFRYLFCASTIGT